MTWFIGQVSQNGPRSAHCRRCRVALEDERALLGSEQDEGLLNHVSFLHA